MPVCQDCGTERGRLERHHVIPRSLGGSDAAENLIDICPNCHDDRHYAGAHGQVNSTKSHSPEANAKRAAAMRAKWADPDYRDRVIAGRDRSFKYQHDRPLKIGATLKQIGHQPPVGPATTPEANARRSATHLANWADPEYRATHSKIKRRPSATRSASIQRAWAEGRYADRAVGAISEKVKQAWADGKYEDRVIDHERLSEAARQREAAKREARRPTSDDD